MAVRTNRVDFSEKLLIVTDLAEVNEILKKHHCSENGYYELGLSLGLSPNTMDAIEKEHKDNTARCMLECLKKWLQVADNVEARSGSPTLTSLINALKKTGQRAVADAIENERPACVILSRHYSTLSQSIVSPIELANILYKEGILSKSSYTSVVSTARSRVKRIGMLLGGVRDAVSDNHINLEKFAKVLEKFSPSAVAVANDIISDYGEHFTDYSKVEIVPDQDNDEKPSVSASHVAVSDKSCRILIPLSWRQEFHGMRSKFASFFSKVRKAIKRHSSLSVTDLKEFLEDAFPSLRSKLHHKQKLPLILSLVREQCTLINIRIIEAIVHEFGVNEVEEPLKQYKEEIVAFCCEVRTRFCIDENLRVVKSHSCLLDCETATFVLDWDADQCTLGDVREFVSEAFGKESNVSIEVISKANSIKVTCSFPVSDAAELIASAAHNISLLKRRGLLYLKIGYCTLYDLKDKQEEIRKEKELDDLRLSLKNKEKEIGKLTEHMKELSHKETFLKGMPLEVKYLQQKIEENTMGSMEEIELLQKITTGQLLTKKETNQKFIYTVTVLFPWKIPEVSKRREDARTGECISMDSPPFYSKPNGHGYKMCLRLFMDGNGIGRGTHMSLFFVIMKGEFDNILQWPFTHKITFKLINHRMGLDVVESICPDLFSSSFQQPKSDMNVASGCPRFVSIKELLQEGFIVDDTIFIEAEVGTSKGVNQPP